MGKYKEAVGKWEHTIGKITHVIEPEEDDNYAFLRIKDEAQKKDSSELLQRKIGTLYFGMVMRSSPSLSEDDQKELKGWIGFNINKICEDFMIAFRWTTPELLEGVKKKVGESPEKERNQ